MTKDERIEEMFARLSADEIEHAARDDIASQRAILFALHRARLADELPSDLHSKLRGLDELFPAPMPRRQ